jgi:glycosyltransferase involved in cell wall biosynthesis
LKAFCKEIEVFELSRKSILLNLIKGVFNSLPYQVNYFLNKSIQTKIRDLINQEKPDKVLVQLPRIAEYGLDIAGIETIIDFQDCFSKIMFGRSEKGNWPFKVLYKWEANRMKKYEARIFSKFDRQIIISDADSDAMPISATEKLSLNVVSNGVETNYYFPQNLEKEFDILFSGNMNYPPNIDAAIFLVKKIMPLVWKVYPKSKVLLLGTEPHTSIRKLASQNVMVSGWVEDVRPYYAKCRIMVAPMRLGAGLQNKLLQAMAMKIPCVSTHLANSSLGAKPGLEILVAETPEENAKAILKLLNDKQFAHNIAENGLRFIKKTYSWENALSAL